MKMIRLWQWLAMSVLAVAMLAPVTMADLPASGGSQTNFYVDAGGDLWAAHVFTADGSFVAIEAMDVEYLIVAGGGGGASTKNSIVRGGGGGGAGGLLQGSASISGSQSVVVGGGGAGRAQNENGTAENGGNSSVFGFTAIGGGGGALNVTDAQSGGVRWR